MRPVDVLRVVLDPAVSPHIPEVTYVIRVILRIAGFGVDFRWAEGQPGDVGSDVYYGPHPETASARVRIGADRVPFDGPATTEPLALVEAGGLGLLRFTSRVPAVRADADAVIVDNDLVFSAYWLLIGAAEAAYPRDRWDNLQVVGSPFHRLQLAARPLVSEYGTWFRHQFERVGRVPAAWSLDEGSRTTVAISHDVDYPEMMRGVELVRALANQDRSRVGRLLRGEGDFWRFSDWMAMTEALGTRSTFFFMTRRGSLWRYLTGTPDAFYDIASPRFRTLLETMVDRGHEVGLHASFHAHRDAGMLRAERDRLSHLVGSEVRGNRHHYWHVDPANPQRTLARQAQAGLDYDSSLAFELIPGFRRSVCHPFRPYDPSRRCEIDLVEIPPAWMDDHFGRRRANNGITDPDRTAEELLAAVGRCGGVAVLDYHVRGLDPDFFPEYGPWLQRFLAGLDSSSVGYTTVPEIDSAYRTHEERLAACSRDAVGQV